MLIAEILMAEKCIFTYTTEERNVKSTILSRIIRDTFFYASPFAIPKSQW